MSSFILNYLYFLVKQNSVDEYETDSEDDIFDKEDEDMLDISKLKILENKRFVCLVCYKTLNAYITKETKGHRDAAVSNLGPVHTKTIVNADNFIWTDDEVQLLLEVVDDNLERFSLPLL